MFIMTMTKRRVLRAVLFFLVLVTGIAIGIFAILSSITTEAKTVKLPIYCVDRADNKISVTFDCAWGNSDTDELIAILKEADVSATFFVTGEFCDSFPDDVKKLYDAGHEIANHSDKHPHVKGMNINELLTDTKECSRKIKMITGEEPTLYRCPYGEYDDTVIATVSGIGLKCIQWNVDSIDWDEASVSEITARTTKNVASGSVLLFHNDTENTVKALPEVLHSLKEQGFEFAKVSEIIYTDRYMIDGDGKQVKLKETVAAVTFSENEVINSAFLKLAREFTAEDANEIATNGMNASLAAKAQAVLTEEEIAAIRELSFEELTELFEKLKTAIESADEEENESGESVEADGGESVSSEDDVIADSRPESSDATSETTLVPDKEGVLQPAPMPESSMADSAESSGEEESRALQEIK